jgi:hypothetical protein
MVRLTILATTLVLLQQQSNAFSVLPGTITSNYEGVSTAALNSYRSLNYDEPDAIMMEQNGGVVPARPFKPIQTRPSAMSRITIEKASDDQHDLNHHDVRTVASEMSAIRRNGATSDDQHDANYHKVRTLPSSVSKIRSAVDSDSDSASAAPIPTKQFKTINAVSRSKSNSGGAKPYYE